MATWHGSLEYGRKEFGDLRLVCSQGLDHNPLAATEKLEFLSIVDINIVPLCLIFGPSYEVYTSSEETKEWFGAMLADFCLPQHDPQDYQLGFPGTLQSPVGILARSIPRGAISAAGFTITELIFYATQEQTPRHGSHPTPPPSSPASHSDDLGARDSSHCLRLHALPLCSHLTQALPTPTSLPRTQDLPTVGQFLPFLQELGSAEKQFKKQKNFSDVFDAASQTRKKARKTGGQRVAAAAAKAGSVDLLIPKKPRSQQEKPKVVEASAKEPAKEAQYQNDVQTHTDGVTRRPYPRSPNISSETMPVSRKSVQVNHRKRSSLSRVTSFPDYYGDLETRNKEAISRIVMAGMRLYGLQTRKKGNHSRRSSELPTERHPNASTQRDWEEAARDEEYKTVYHQAFKGTVCALRQYVTKEPLYQRPEVVQDVVDRLLGIFCTDPLAAG